MTYRQLPLQFARDETFLEHYLSDRISKRVAVTITDNRVSMISVRKKKEIVSVRMHRIFLTAPDDVIGDIAAFIKHTGVKTPSLTAYIKAHRDKLPAPRPTKVTVRPGGKHFNLQEIFDALNSEYFNGRLSSSITWGRFSPRQAVKKRTLGSYRAETDTIRINPVLDRRGVPRYFVEYVVYHEMLHAAVGVRQKNGRRIIHSREFKQREKLYRHFDRAVRWERERFGEY